MSARQLDVLTNGQLVGQLREENDLWQFEYDEQWTASPRGFDLAPAMPRTTRLHADGASNRPVQWYFDNLLPEEALRTVLAKEADLNAEDAFGLLAYFGAESAGSLELRDAAPQMAVQHGVRPLSRAALSERIRNLSRTSLTKDAPKRMSLAGAQHKMLVLLKGAELYEPLAGTPSTHILKPNHYGDDYPASVMNEYFTMRLAAAAGLDVPKVHRLYVPQPVYVVDRFDRLIPAGGDADAVVRRHVIDTCQLLNKARSFKYTAARLETLAEAIGYCRSRVSARLQLYRWIVFNALVGNGDNHLKNISFLVGSGGINLAPTYDLLSTAAYDTRAMADDRAKWPHTPLAFSLGDAQTFADIRRAHILLSASMLGLAPTTAARELDSMLALVPAAADTLIGEIDTSIERDAASSPEPEVARSHIAGERRLLLAIRHVVLADMCRQLA